MASQTPSPDPSFSSAHLESLASLTLSECPETQCGICHKPCILPKVLSCLHTFCKPCLEKLFETLEKIVCPICKQECTLPAQGISEFLSDYAVNNVVEDSEDNTAVSCTGCRSKDLQAVAHCYDCSNNICGNCVMAHQYMHCFEGHQIVNLVDEVKDDFKVDKLLYCPRHKNETLRLFCRTCDVPICRECTNVDHPIGFHDYDHISNAGPRQVEMISELLGQSLAKTNDLKSAFDAINKTASSLKMKFIKAKAEINDAFNYYCCTVDDRKKELLKELLDLYNTKKVSLSLTRGSIQEMVERIQQMSVFVERIMKFSSDSEVLMFKHILDTKLQAIISYKPDINLHSMDLEFLSNFQAIQVGVRNTFGYIRHHDVSYTKPQPVTRPNGMINPDYNYQNGHVYEANIKQFGANCLGLFPPPLNDTTPYEKWSSGDIFQNGIDTFQLNTEPVIDIPPPTIVQPITYPLKSEVRRQKMIYYCKFGEFGIIDGQFTEPSGVAVNAQNNIIVADTNSHRIQVFDRDGRYKFNFGECGKQNGQLLYPNRVAVVRTSGDIIVTERSPTHQIQIYTQYGQFVRKFGANILQHPRGVTVDNNGLIIVVECKVMRVIIFDQSGNVMKKFGCSKHLEFPNGVVVNDKQEIFISDNRAHCVKVFNYEGVYLRQVGGEGLTNYPIGVCINRRNEILIADNHNNFNITIFNQDGLLVGATESKVKHDQCFDVALMDDGSIVLASKDYRLYLYRYTHVSSPPV